MNEGAIWACTRPYSDGKGGRSLTPPLSGRCRWNDHGDARGEETSLEPLLDLGDFLARVLEPDHGVRGVAVAVHYFSPYVPPTGLWPRLDGTSPGISPLKA